MTAPRAMILAAGLGTRLRPLTNDRPKALVGINGRTLLEITLARLRAFGVKEVIVNVHHFADKVVDYLRANGNFGMRVEVSREDELLDTGGGLKKAAWFFEEDGGDKDTPFLLHNVDVLSNIDFGRMLETHVESRALATLAVQNRSTSRYLIFDESNELCGRRPGKDGQPELVRDCATPRAVAFSGIHLISTRVLSMLTEDGAFSIITSYLRLGAQGEKIQAFAADKYYWRDLGRPENIAQAEQDVQKHLVRL